MSGDISDNSALRPQAPVAAGTTLGLLPLIALSAALTGPAFGQDGSQTRRTDRLPGAESTAVPSSGGGVTELDVITVEGSGGDQAADSYKVDRGAAATLTAPLLDTPRTVKVITQRQIEERGATSVEDVLRTTPGVTLGTGEGGTPFGTRPYIRGFEAAFSTAVDGVRTRGRTTYESFNLETIEINMGSDGVTAGAGAAAGSINMTTKDPREGETFQNFSGTVGNAEHKRTTYDGNFAINEDVTARINLMWQDSGVPGSKHVEDNKWGVAPAFSWRMGDASKLTFKLQHVHESGVPGARMPFANAAWNNNSHLPGWADYGSGTPDDPYLPLEHLDRNNFYGVLGRDFRDSNNTAVNLKFEHEFANGLTMTSVASWLQTDVKMAIMRPAVSVAGGRFVVNRNGNGGVRYSNRGTDTATFTTNFSGEFDWAGLGHSVSFGVEAARDRVRNGSTPVAVTTPNGTPLFNPNPWDPFIVTGDFGPLGAPVTTDTRAVYLFDTVTINDQWKVNGGIRVEDFRIDNGQSLSWGDVLFDYQLGLMYKPLPNTTIYASYNTTSSPPGACANQGGSNCPSESLNPSTITTKAEKTENFEVGVKHDLFDGDLSLTAAVFSTEKRNQRVADENGDYTLNVGSSRGRGFDLGVGGRVTDRWSIVAGYSYLDAKVTDGGPNFAEANTGNRPINTAEHTFALWSTFAVNEKFTIGGGANYVSMKYVNPENTYAVPAFWRVDAMAAYKFNDHATLQVNVNNLFDETYFDSSHVGSFATLQPGRSITGRINVSF